jgi:hypothetical protein
MMNGTQLFAKLCEGLVFEVSSTLNMVKGRPGGNEVIQKLHREYGLSHEQDYAPITKISWSELKDMSRGAWVIIDGANGVGAIKQQSGSYIALASKGGEVDVFNNDRGGNIIDFLKGKIGKLNTYYQGRNTTAVKDKQKSRADAKAGATPGQVTTSVLMTKFKPMWEKAMVAAMADVKGMIGIMIQNDSFEKAERKLKIVQQLDSGLDKIRYGDIPDIIEPAVKQAVALAASHYYPDETGEITKSYGSSWSSASQDGPRKLLADISNGDMKKMGTVLGFFKRALVTL